MKYHLFYGERFYPSGGYKDYQGNFNSIEEAKKAAEDISERENKDAWAHIVLEDKIILEGKFDPFFNEKFQWDQT